jgi:hypothetical protein
LAYATANDKPQILRLNQGQLFDLDGNVVYVSEGDLTATSQSNLYFTQSGNVPADGLTSVFSTDSDGDLVVIVHGQQLIAIICNDDEFILFGTSAGSCEAVTLGPYAVPSSAPASIASTPSYPSPFRHRLQLQFRGPPAHRLRLQSYNPVHLLRHLTPHPADPLPPRPQEEQHLPTITTSQVSVLMQLVKSLFSKAMEPPSASILL